MGISKAFALDRDARTGEHMLHVSREQYLRHAGRAENWLIRNNK
jgi:hypothetical protein